MLSPERFEGRGRREASYGMAAGKCEEAGSSMRYPVRSIMGTDAVEKERHDLLRGHRLAPKKSLRNALGSKAELYEKLANCQAGSKPPIGS